MANLAEHVVFNSQGKDQEFVEAEVSRYECTNCFNISNQCLIDVCPHCGETLVERHLRPSELLELQESMGSRTVSSENETVFHHESKLA